MATKRKPKGELKGKARLRSEIVEAMRGLHKIGAVSDAELEKTSNAAGSSHCGEVLYDWRCPADRIPRCGFLS